VFLLERHEFVALEVFYTFVRMIFALFAVLLQNVPNYERRAAAIYTVRVACTVMSVRYRRFADSLVSEPCRKLSDDR